jgi:shikimate dehydrogenase
VPVAVLTTGGSGPILRALARRLGAPLAFASLPDRSERSAVEPSQVPVDRLRPFLYADGDAPLFAVAGRPVAHSQSPRVHSRWMAAAGHPGLYVPLEFADDAEFVESLPLLAEAGFRGLNVTHPFKAAAFEAATSAAPGAEAVRAANCLTLRNGEVLAENTDLAAVLRRLEELRSGPATQAAGVTVLGAGGAARATLAAARLLRLPATVVARRPEAARAVAREFDATALPPGPVPPGTIVVHATAAGRGGAEDLDGALGAAVAHAAYVLDWVYRPESPRVADLARSAGAPYEDGWRLFVYQAAASYSVWWDEEPAARVSDELLGEGACAA